MQNVICRTGVPKFAFILIYGKKFTNQTIVRRGNWLGNPANIKVENIYGAVGYVGISLTVRNPLVFVVHGQVQKIKLTKTYNKGFPNHSTLINYDQTQRLADANVSIVLKYVAL